MASEKKMSFAAWCAAADTAGASRSILVKTAAIADALAACVPDDAERAARFFSGRVFRAGDPRTLGIGGAALSRAIIRVAGIDAETLTQMWGRHADARLMTRDAMGQSPARHGDGISLAELGAALAEIAVAGAAARDDLLVALLERCSPNEAGYVAGLVSGELRIGLREGIVEAAISKAFDAGAKDVERAAMLLGDLGDVASLAAQKRLDEARPALMTPLRSMLANAAGDSAEVIRRLGDDVWVEDKYDGIRCQLHATADRTALFSRDLNDISAQFPEVADANWPTGLILDGEIIAFRDGRVMPFFALQKRLGRRRPSQAIRDEIPVVYVAWDVLATDDGAQIDAPLVARRRVLEALQLPAVAVLSHHEAVHGVAALDAQFTAARERLNEGLMVKNPASPYLPGRRGYHWMKLKRPLDTLDVVVVGAEYGHGKRRDVLSDVTFAVRNDENELVTLGKAYTGLTDVEIAEMTTLLQELALTQYGRYHSVTPSIVLEVAFDSVQESKRHKSGYALRFPRIVRWRHDRSSDDVDTLDRVRGIATARAEAFTQRVDPAQPTV